MAYVRTVIAVAAAAVGVVVLLPIAGACALWDLARYMRR